MPRRSVESPVAVLTTFQMSPATYAAVKAICVASGTTMKAFVSGAVEARLRSLADGASA
jgi:hypothetical protein